MADATPLPINAMSSTIVSDLVDHFRLETQLHPDFTLEIVRAVPPRGRRIVRTEKKWTKESDLGYGTFGEVWLEKNQKGEARAVKGVKKRKNTGIDYYKELLAMAKLSKHLQLFVEFFGWYETRDSLFIAMEYLEHGDLHKHILRTGTCSENDAKAIAYQLLEGLGVMHEMGFAHRDLKPQNIFVSQPSPDWWIKIGDFGIAKRVQITDETAFRTEIGTRVYRAPEVDCLLDEDSEEYTNLVDIWSLGCVIFWILTKEVPFASTNKLYDFVHETIPFPSSPLETKGVSEGCLGFLQRTIAIQPSDRPTAQKALESQWLKDIDVGTVHEESPALVASPPETSEHPQSLPSESSESLDQSKVGKPSPQNAAQEVDSHSEIGDEMTLKPENARLIQTVSPVQETSPAKDTSPVLENQAVQDQPWTFRDLDPEISERRVAGWVLENDEGYTSVEEINETIEQRVARITARDAELTANEDGTPVTTPSTPSKEAVGYAPQISGSTTKEPVLSKLNDKKPPESKSPERKKFPLRESKRIPLAVPSRKELLLRLFRNHPTRDLFKAIKAQHNEEFFKALKNGANPYETVKDGFNELAAIHMVAKYGTVTMLDALLQKGVRPEMRPANRRNGKMALHIAVVRNSRPMVERLLHAHAPLDAVDNTERTPLGLAIALQLVDMARLLLESGANVDGPSFTKPTLLLETYSSTVHGSETRLEMVKLLIEFGANVNAADEDGKTALFYAVQWECFAEAKWLLVAGANINAIDVLHKTPLVHAIDRNDLSPFRFLTEYGADIPSMESLNRPQWTRLNLLQKAAEKAQEETPKVNSSNAS